MNEENIQLKKLNDEEIKKINSLYESEDSYLIFTIKDNRYSIKGSEILQVVNNPKIRELPFVPSFIEGIMNVSGTLFTAVNVLKMNGDDDCEISGPQYIVLKRLDDQISIHVSNIERFFEPEKQDIFEDRVKYKNNFVQLFNSDIVEKKVVKALSGNAL